MPQGSKSAYTPKQKRMAHKIEKSAKERGHSQKRAEEIGWATVNKKTGGGKQKGTSGSGSKRSSTSSGSKSSGSKSSGSKGGGSSSSRSKKSS